MIALPLNYIKTEAFISPLFRLTYDKHWESFICSLVGADTGNIPAKPFDGDQIADKPQMRQLRYTLSIRFFFT